jgi:hypothetical protein
MKWYQYALAIFFLPGLVYSMYLGNQMGRMAAFVLANWLDGYVEWDDMTAWMQAYSGAMYADWGLAACITTSACSYVYFVLKFI